MASSSFHSARGSPEAIEDPRVTLRRKPEIDSKLRIIAQALDNNEASATTVRQVWDQLHDSWWKVASDINRRGFHQGRRYHILDFPSFITEAVPHDRLDILLRLVFAADFNTAKLKPEGANRLKNAALALELVDPIFLFLWLGPAICAATNSLKAISSLKKSRSHEPVDAAAITDAIRQQMVGRHMLSASPEDMAPMPSVADVTNAVDQLRKAAPAKAVRPAAQASRAGRKRKADDEEDDESVASVRRQSKRRRVSSEELSELARDAYDEQMADKEPSFLSSFMTSGFVAPDRPGGDNLGSPPPLRNDDETALANDDNLQQLLNLCAMLVSAPLLTAESGLPLSMRLMLENTKNAARSALLLARDENVVEEMEERMKSRESLGVESESDDV
ncbi:hypothetical protein CkaCkLH20_01987 [Colletotrichum karsti]|uniref:Uncharacterized protein n=1 Tax=Colletotrichum karsti TaxID=1095194 RepID=A0A9P6IJ37_9PEZI|nr:uncharacterized protein CkaCkLH20_01987 [Colletotrichum karsti]KAF9880945.1 hypothetical protein CkaCkLH20_01987 [Colletotrichum karsti]